MRARTEKTPDPGCLIEGCTATHHGRGLCHRHYSAAARSGTLTQHGPVARPHRDPAERFFEKVDTAGPCWERRDGINDQGYGRFYAGPGAPQKDVYAHRWAYEHLVGPIPEGLTLDHLCRNLICVNPDHLDPVTVGENARRMGQRIWCASGRHRLDETAIVRPTGKRYCGECGRERSRKRTKTSIRPDRPRIATAA